MSVTVRRFRTGGWEVDLSFRLPNGQRYRERCKAPGCSKSAAQRWGEDRERHLILHGLPEPKKEVPTVEQFATRFVDEYARANRQKPSSIAAKEGILKAHIVPFFGSERLDAITTDKVQRLKGSLREKAPKTVNNILAVLSVMLKTATAWNVIDRVPCCVTLVPTSKSPSDFHEFDDYQRLVKVAASIGSQTLLLVLLGGDAGLRCGEMVALEWTDIDWTNCQLIVRHSDWKGHVTSPKGGRARFVPMTERLAGALKAARHASSHRIICREDGGSLRRQNVQKRVRRAARLAGVKHQGIHVLRHTFCSHLAMRGAPARAIQELAGHRDLSTTERYMHLSPSALTAAIRLLETPSIAEMRGDILETRSQPFESRDAAMR